MPDNKSNMYHVIYRCLTDDINETKLHNDNVNKFVAEYSNSISTLTYILVGKEQGAHDHKWHFHMTIKWDKVVTTTTTRKRLSKYFETKYLRTSVVRDEMKSLVYTIKGKDPFNSYGLKDERVKEIKEAWQDRAEYKKTAQTDVHNHILNLQSLQIPLHDKRQVTQYVLEYYRDNYKRFNYFQVKSLIQGILIHDTNYLKNLYEKIIFDI